MAALTQDKGRAPTSMCTYIINPSLPPQYLYKLNVWGGGGYFVLGEHLVHVAHLLYCNCIGNKMAFLRIKSHAPIRGGTYLGCLILDLGR